MKYLKICSFAVALLLFASPAMAALECNLQSESHDLRAESKHEKLDDLEVVCSWASGDFIVPAGSAGENIPMFDLEVILSADLSNMDDMEPYLEFAGALVPASGTTPEMTMVTPVDVGSDDIEWEDVRLPIDGTFDTGDDANTWDADNDWDDGAAGSASFKIKGIYLDASEAGDEVMVSIRMTVSNALAANISFESDRDRVDVADVDPGIEELVFTPEAKMGKPGAPNACNPAKFTVEVDVEEGFRGAWATGNDIGLSISSGSMKDMSADGPLEVVERESDPNMLVYAVTNTRSRQTANLKIEITPPVAEEDDEITLSAEFLPRDPRTIKGEEFDVSDMLVVATYGACKGEKLFFPFVTSNSGWDTGIAVVNNSNADGMCYLNWGDMKLEEDEMEALSTIDVDKKDNAIFQVSDQRGSDHSGSLGVQCTFKEAWGYIFLYDSSNMTGQGYIIEGR